MINTCRIRENIYITAIGKTKIFNNHNKSINPMDKKTEQNDISELVKNSLETMSNETPKHIVKKSEADGILEQIQGTKRQFLTIYNHIHSIGADDHVLVGKNKEKNRMILQKWFQTLVIQNQRFPTDIPVDFVLQEFFNAILQKRVELKGFNLLAHMTAFHNWLDSCENELKGKWWRKQNPNQRPKEIAARSEDPEEIDTDQMKESIEALYGKVPENMKKYVE
jgi:hypothetical protein